MFGENLFIQGDKRWGLDIMTCKDDLYDIPYEKWKVRWAYGYDYIWNNGSFLVSWCNISPNMITPHELNKEIRNNDGYLALKLKESCPIGKESCIDIDVVKKILNIKEVIADFKGPLEFDNEKVKYIAKVPLDPHKGVWSSHYNAIVTATIERTPIHFDSDSGINRTDWQYENDNYKIIKVIFK